MVSLLTKRESFWNSETGGGWELYSERSWVSFQLLFLAEWRTNLCWRLTWSQKCKNCSLPLAYTVWYLGPLTAILGQIKLILKGFWPFRHMVNYVDFVDCVNFINFVNFVVLLIPSILSISSILSILWTASVFMIS